MASNPDGLARVVLASPRGFCAGVDRAIDIVDRALELFGSPIYVKHEVVHNRTVVVELRAKGAVFVESLAEAPDGAILIFSAHGVSRAVEAEADARNMKVFDATCPLVTKVHLEVHRFSKEPRECVLIGHAGHPEVEGTLGRYDRRHGGEIYLVERVSDVAALEVRDAEKLAYVTQTTLSVDDTREVVEALARRFPSIEGPRQEDICYATQNRQQAVKKLADAADVVLVVGSANSSNSNRLKEIAAGSGKPAYLVDSVADVDRGWIPRGAVVGVTAGASAPESLVDQVVERLQSWGAGSVTTLEGVREEVVFALPRELRLIDLTPAEGEGRKEARD